MNERKSLYDISWQVDEPTYRASNALSYSILARYHREGFNGLDKLFDRIESPSLLFGSMVDSLITGGQEEFDRLFVVAEFPNIPDSQSNIVKYLFELCSESCPTLNDISDEKIIAAAEVFEFQKNWKPETRAKVLKENGKEYYNLLHLCTDKTLVSTKDYRDAEECVYILKTGETKKLFEPNIEGDSIERFYQLKFKGTYNNINLRCMADLIIVDHERKIVHPYDLKTSFKKEWDFYHSFIQWGYWIQAQLYWYIIRQNMDNDPIFKDYELDDYQFVVISNGSRIPLIWTYEDTQDTFDRYYGVNEQIKCRNWRYIANELDYYLKNKPKVPVNIKLSNSITKWLNNE